VRTASCRLWDSRICLPGIIHKSRDGNCSVSSIRVLRRGYTHRFPRPMCCPTSTSLSRFKTSSDRGNRTECACSFFPISSHEVFCLSAKRRPSEPRTRKSDTPSDVRVVRRVWFPWTTPRTRKIIIGACSHGFKRHKPWLVRWSTCRIIRVGCRMRPTWSVNNIDWAFAAKSISARSKMSTHTPIVIAYLSCASSVLTWELEWQITLYITRCSDYTAQCSFGLLNCLQLLKQYFLRLNS